MTDCVLRVFATFLRGKALGVTMFGMVNFRTFQQVKFAIMPQARRFHKVPKSPLVPIHNLLHFQLQVTG
jgi:hypothetical protein